MRIDREKLIDRYVKLCIDHMSIGELTHIAKEHIYDGLNDLPESDAFVQMLADFPNDFPELAHCA